MGYKSYGWVFQLEEVNTVLRKDLKTVGNRICKEQKALVAMGNCDKQSSWFGHSAKICLVNKANTYVSKSFAKN